MEKHFDTRLDTDAKSDQTPAPEAAQDLPGEPDDARSAAAEPSAGDESGEFVAMEDMDQDGESAAEERSPDGALDEMQRECEHLQDQLLRARAEFDNYRKRVAREGERLRKMAAESVIRDLLPVLDHLELALQHRESGADSIIEGVEMVLRQLLDVLGRHGLEPIPAVGEEFDPNVHDAMMQQASDEFEANTVVAEFQKGYRLADQVLRPSKVIVSAGPAEEGAAETGQPADNESAGPDNCEQEA